MFFGHLVSPPVAKDKSTAGAFGSKVGNRNQSVSSIRLLASFRCSHSRLGQNRAELQGLRSAGPARLAGSAAGRTCLGILRRLIAKGDVNGIRLAERAINEYWDITLKKARKSVAKCGIA
jgi:hypothetical protein